MPGHTRRFVRNRAFHNVSKDLRHLPEYRAHDDISQERSAEAQKILSWWFVLSPGATVDAIVDHLSRTSLGPVYQGSVVSGIVQLAWHDAQQIIGQHSSERDASFALASQLRLHDLLVKNNFSQSVDSVIFLLLASVLLLPTFLRILA